MKKVLIALTALLVAGTVSFAAEQSATVKAPKAPKAEGKRIEKETLSFSGVVESITAVNKEKKAMSEIVVVGEKETKMTFMVTPKTTFYSTKDPKEVLTLDKIVKGDKVTVKYRGKEKHVIATMITK